MASHNHGSGASKLLSDRLATTSYRIIRRAIRLMREESSSSPLCFLRTTLLNLPKSASRQRSITQTSTPTDPFASISCGINGRLRWPFRRVCFLFDLQPHRAHISQSSFPFARCLRIPTRKTHWCPTSLICIRRIGPGTRRQRESGRGSRSSLSLLYTIPCSSRLSCQIRHVAG